MLANERRRTISRQDLHRNPAFHDVSPQLGELDLGAFDDLFDSSPDAAIELLAQMTQATDRTVAALSRRLAGRLVMDVARTGTARSRGVGRLVRAHADESSSDIDIDSSLEALASARAERRGPALDELVATRWRQPLTAVCLLIDRSGSMNGARLASGALAGAVCSWRSPQHFAVIAFADKAVVIKSLNEAVAAEQLVTNILALRGHGTTDLRVALIAAQRQLAMSAATRRVTILLSDAEVTAGGDPVPAARGLDELIVIAPSEAPDHAQALVAAAGGRFVQVTGPMSVLDALQSAFA